MDSQQRQGAPRTEMIARHGEKPGDPLLDSSDLMQEFTTRWSDRYDAALADSAHWPDLPIERIRELRLLKNELTMLSRIPLADSVIAPWIALWKHLP